MSGRPTESLILSTSTVGTRLAPQKLSRKIDSSFLPLIRCGCQKYSKQVIKYSQRTENWRWRRDTWCSSCHIPQPSLITFLILSGVGLHSNPIRASPHTLTLDSLAFCLSTRRTAHKKSNNKSVSTSSCCIRKAARNVANVLVDEYCLPTEERESEIW